MGPSFLCFTIVDQIQAFEDSEIASLVDWDAVDAFRKRALSFEHPTARVCPHLLVTSFWILTDGCSALFQGMPCGNDIYFQWHEAPKANYEAMPGVVQSVMNQVLVVPPHYWPIFPHLLFCMVQVAEMSGRQYHLVDYHGVPDATHVVVCMGSGANTVRETVDYLTGKGEKVGLIQVCLLKGKHFRRGK